MSSCDGLEIVDYTLTLPNYPVWNYRNHEPFRLLLEEVVCDDTTPMLADFTFLKCIGNGASSQVYLVRHNSNGQLYALKQIGKEYFKDFKRMEQVLREKKIMTDIVADLTFVIKLYCSFESCYFLNFLFEFYPGGELFYHLRQAKFTED